VHFAGFPGVIFNSPSKPNQLIHGFTHGGATLKSVVHSSRRLSFDANMPFGGRVGFYNGLACSLWSSQLIDEDGTLTGVTSGAYVVPDSPTLQEQPWIINDISTTLRQLPFKWDKAFNLPPANEGTACTRFASDATWSKAMICSERAGLLRFNNPVWQAKWVNFTRSDNLIMSDPLFNAQTQWLHTSVSLKKTSISYAVENFNALPWYGMRLMDVLPGDWVIYRSDLITANSVFTMRNPQGTWVSIPSCGSWSGLLASTSTCVYTDLAVGSAWTKIVSGAYPFAADFGIHRAQMKYNGVAEINFVR
jgi:hypothetical protein